ncbi:hypothetical protein JCM10450v2_003698 [Rhodotorula kratochvilovae]
MEWSWDGSIISLSDAPPADSPPARTPSTARSLGASYAALPASSPAESHAGFGHSSAGDSARLPTPPERAYLSRDSHAFAPTSTPSPSPDSTPSHSLATQQAYPHPLASFLLAEHSLSPPASPTASTTSSFAGPRTRLSSAASAAVAGGEVGTRSRSRHRPRGRGRTGSVSSTASTDGSAHEDRAGELSSEDDHHAGGLVMPSLRFSRTAEHAATPADEQRGVKVLVLGKTPEDRRTLATLLAHDDDLRRTASGASVVAPTDMSFSFLSMRPSERSASSGRSAASQPGLFEPLVPSSAPVALYHLARENADDDRLVDELTRPLERLEAKLNRAYPTTTGLAEVVEAAGCGEFEACFFLFSSPPLASEIAVARPVSHVLPVFPVLVLPPSPTGKPQKTTALSQAVQEQLDTAGVRWLPALSLPRSPAASGAGPLYMLPHDLFVQHAHAPPHVASSTASTHASSPASEDAPTSLSSSTEFVPPHHPSSAYTSSAPSSIAGTPPHPAAARSLSASSRAGSSSSRSSSPPRRAHTRHASLSSLASASSRSGASASASAASSTSLADLRRLQAAVHHPSAAAHLRRSRARAFLEWREVEIAASSASFALGTDTAWDLLAAWGETALSAEEGARGGRRALDFSKRVAERRRALSLRGDGHGRAHAAEEDDHGDVLAASDDDDDDQGEEVARASFATDPMTPRCGSSRPLHSPLAARRAPAPAAVDSYFPPQPGSDALSSSVASLSSTSASSSGGAGSVLVLPSADPFHLPSLLHLVGLNLRLAVFAPSLTSSPAASVAPSSSSQSQSRREKSTAPAPMARQNAPGWGWWRAAAVVGLVFAAGVGVGALVVDATSAGGAWAPGMRY